KGGKAPWFNNHLMTLKRNCRKIERKWRKSLKEEDREEHRGSIRLYQKEIRLAQATFYGDKIEKAAGSPKEIFGVLKELLYIPACPEAMEASEEHSNNFASFFLKKIEDIYENFSGEVGGVAGHAMEKKEGDNVLQSFLPISEEGALGLLSKLKS
ncbi:hypothetical protein NDU88_003008, partial [Pleurodeles waltl]